LLYLGPSLEADARPEAREPVLALLSHEMRTPLNGVLGMAGLLAATKLDPTQQAYLSALRESGELLLGLVNDILDLAKLDSRPLELEPVDTDVERLLQGVCELLSPRAHGAGIEIAWGTLGRLPRLRADDGRLRQILFNLAGNAIKLTQTGGVLLTAAKAESGAEDDAICVRFSVKDTGPGVAAEAQTRIFEAFEQTEAGVRAGGAGLGLAIVKRLAAAFGGELGLDSPPGEGAEFWFQAQFALAEAEPKAWTPPLPLAGRRVAVVSANPIVRQAAKMQIETCGGQVVDTTCAAEQSPPVAVLIDPDPAGAPAPPPPGAPAIVLLSPEARDRIEAFRAAGYAGYLIKPLRRASLAARVLAVLGEPAAALTPFATAEVEDERDDDERARGGPPEGLRVLLAEDNPVNALLARALLTQAGCVVDRAATGEEALTALEKAPYDVVLMDMRMPGMDGLTATRTLRGRGDRTPVIALTANAFEDDRRACLESGMDDYLTKPLEPKALQAALARWTHRG
jgi:CheY-like chemotaxis protein